MTKKIIIAAGLLATALSPGAASAGVYADDLGKCLVTSATQADQTLLVQWIFSLTALNPAVKPMVIVTDAQREDYTKRAAALYQRLIYADCRAQSVAALKYEGPIAMESSFGVLGQVAMRGLMADPAVMGGLQDFAKYNDKAKAADLAREAGIPQPPPLFALPAKPAQ